MMEKEGLECFVVLFGYTLERVRTQLIAVELKISVNLIRLVVKGFD
jgi:hypothetical protein